jgi:hypothetical protein
VNIASGNEVRKHIKKAKEYQRGLLARIIYEIFQKKIPLRQSSLNLIKQKRKYKVLHANFSNREAFNDMIQNDRDEKVLLDIVSVLPALVEPLVKKSLQK